MNKKLFSIILVSILFFGFSVSGFNLYGDVYDKNDFKDITIRKYYHIGSISNLSVINTTDGFYNVEFQIYEFYVNKMLDFIWTEESGYGSFHILDKTLYIIQLYLYLNILYY